MSRRPPSISVMSSIKALKRRSEQRKNNSSNNIEDSKTAVLRRSFSEFSVKGTDHINLRKTKSLPDLKLQPANITVKSAKSEININSVFNHNIMEVSSYSVIEDNDSIKIPIVGYELVEERKKFTVFKLKIQNNEKNWLVLRRFTDFTRLHTKLKQLYPNVNLILPKKKWFGNNFSAGFLDTRVAGLQTFINTILSDVEMRKCPTVREFFCLDDPPLFSESMEDCKAIFEAQEETIAFLKMQLKAKDETIMNLTHKNDYLTSLVKSSIGKCLKTDNSF